MAQRVIYTDLDELNLLLKSNVGRESHLIAAADVRRISFGRYTDKKLFGLIKKPARRITMMIKGMPPIEFDEPRNAEYFEQYLTELRDFCRRNRVTFYDFPEK